MKRTLKIYKVSNHLYRGPRPFSYEQLKEEIPDVSVIVDLQSGIQNWFGDTPYETDSARAHGIRRDCHHLSDWERPSAQRLLSIADDIQAYLAAGETVYIHCKHGKDRTGMVDATHSMKYRGWGHNAAVNVMLSLGFHQFPYSYWIRSLDEVATILKKNEKQIRRRKCNLNT